MDAFEPIRSAAAALHQALVAKGVDPLNPLALVETAAADLDIELVYRFIRDTVWVAVRWYRPGGDLTHTHVADQYLSILLEGISRA